MANLRFGKEAKKKTFSVARVAFFKTVKDNASFAKTLFFWSK